MTVDGTHTYARFGTYTTTVVVTDDGGSTVTLPGSATVTDPAITGVSHNFTSVEGQSSGSVLLATITDPNTLATAADITALLSAWGDGTPASPVPLTVVQVSSTPTDTVFDVFGAHNYHEEGAFTFSLSVTTLDPTNPAITLTGTATVTDAALTGSSGTELTGVEGATTGSVLVGTFTDANPFGLITDFTTSINWGDGTTSAGTVTQPGGIGTVFLVNGTHTYTEEGTYAVTVTVTDDGGSSTVVAGSAIIADADAHRRCGDPADAQHRRRTARHHGRRHLHRRQHVRHRPPTSPPPSTGATARRGPPASSSPPPPPASSTSREAIPTPSRASTPPRSPSPTTAARRSS